MKAKGRHRVTLVQKIHGKVYLFCVRIMANDENETKRKAVASYPGYYAI